MHQTHARTTALLALAVGLAWGCSPPAETGAGSPGATPTPGGAAATAPPAAGEVAPEFELKTVDGDSVSLRSLTAERPTALVVLRGYPGYQ